jgi:inosine-uridine nucleoside N-ribohydrolase
VDDILGILLALSSDNIELELISLCCGNCDTTNSLRNILSLFHVLRLENEYRTQQPGSRGQAPYSHQKPRIAVGLEQALDGAQHDAAELHGSDGLGGVHTLASEFSASQEWIRMFKAESHGQEHGIGEDLGFIPSKRPSYLEILDILKKNPPNTVTICAIGPLMNLAKAAEIDPVTFSRVRNIVSMGGALSEPGNVTPLAEFNVFADPVAAARIYALTSASPQLTLPENSPESLMKFAALTQRPIPLVIFPLDITHRHVLEETVFLKTIEPKAKSPLARWVSIWMNTTFQAMQIVNRPEQGTILYLHDPLAVWYAITQDEPGWIFEQKLDIRVETKGEWTRGCLVVDRRGRSRESDPKTNDRGHWLQEAAGNRVDVCVDSPGIGNLFGAKLMELIFH